MSESSSSAAPAAAPSQSAHPRGVPQGAPQGATGGGPQVTRQFVNFSFWRLDPSFRRLPVEEKQAARREMVEAVEARRDGLICLTYSTVSMRAECDFLLWRI